MAASRLWFERLFARLGLSLWTGSFLIVTLPFFVGLALGYLAAGLWNDFVALLPVTLSAAAMLFACQPAARHVCDRLETLREYARSMREGDTTIDIRPMYDGRKAFGVGLLLNLVVNPLYVVAASSQFSAAELLLTTVATWPLFLFFAATFFWVWAYGMVSIYRMGKLPLKLQPFTEDRTLGLRPFARAALRLAAIYLGLLFVLSFANILGGSTNLLLTLLFMAFLLMGIAFFVVPLVPLHSKLQRAKSEKTRWIGSEYSKTLESIETIGDSRDEGLFAKLVAIDKIQRDIQQIRTWPFDAGVLVRLTAIIVSVIAILLARFLVVVFGL